MSFFPRTFYGPDPSFTPLFRLLDDFDNYSREVQGSKPESGNQQGGRHHAVRTFNPRFDVRETENAYELHGELPGIERDQVNIEFTEPQTIVIRGRIERTYESGPRHSGAIEGGAQSSGAIEGSQSHKATVEEEQPEQANVNVNNNNNDNNNNKNDNNEKNGSAVTKASDHKAVEKKKPAERFWVSERSIGEFSRTFSFPTRVEQEGVTANLNNGLLTVVVPKAKKHDPRRIAIN